MCQWTHSLPLKHQYDELLRDNGVDGEVLDTLDSEERWQKVGVVFGDAVKLAKRVRLLKQ